MFKEVKISNTSKKKFGTFSDIEITTTRAILSFGWEKKLKLQVRFVHDFFLREEANEREDVV